MLFLHRPPFCHHARQAGKAKIYLLQMLLLRCHKHQKSLRFFVTFAMPFLLKNSENIIDFIAGMWYNICAYILPYIICNFLYQLR